MSNETLAVALCTYNGSEFLREQLDSIAGQTSTPDLLVVVDDRSQDDSVAIAEDFARTAPFEVRIVTNERNLGYARNFEKAIGLADADVVALSDQDDVWEPHKLQAMRGAFAAGASLVFSDATLTDGELKPLGHRLWDVVGFTAAEQARVAQGGLFERLVRGNIVTGATMAFRTDLRPLVLPVHAEGVHDAWISLVASCVAPAAVIQEPLIRYRQHGRNQIGAKNRTVIDRVSAGRSRTLRDLRLLRDQHALALERLAAWGAAEEKLALLRDAIAHLDVRTRLPVQRARRIPRVAREWASGRYHARANGSLSALRDLLM
jgi:glycosyltransferase involved in cell wall biosynthesis